MSTRFSMGLAVLATACFAPAQETLGLDSPRPLSGYELQAVLLGNTLIESDELGTYWMYYATPDAVWGRNASGDVDIGRWWIENDSYCRAWRLWFGGETRCWNMAFAGDESILWYSLSGEVAGRTSIRRGNAIGEPPSDGSRSSQFADAGIGSAIAPDAVKTPAAAGTDSEAAGRRAAHFRGDDSGSSRFLGRLDNPPVLTPPRGPTGEVPDPTQALAAREESTSRRAAAAAPAPAPAPAETAASSSPANVAGVSLSRGGERLGGSSPGTAAREGGGSEGEGAGAGRGR